MTTPLDDRAFTGLVAYLLRLPAIDAPAGEKSIGWGTAEDGCWWMKFSLNLHHRLVWHTVQELGCVLNNLSITERLPTVFKPVSPAPYLNGGPADFLSWVIETSDPEFRPGHCARWLEGRLPRPVEDESAWDTNGELAGENDGE